MLESSNRLGGDRSGTVGVKATGREDACMGNGVLDRDVA